MNEAILHALTIPVIMLMIRDLEFQREEFKRDRQPTTNLDEAIKICKEVLEEKQS